jgi:hypothetical protein
MTDEATTRTAPRRRVCRLRLTRDARLGWTLRVDPDDAACQAVLHEIHGALGPHGRRYLAKRIRGETSHGEDEA